MAYVRAILLKLKDCKPAKPVSGQNCWTARCPAHDDRKTSLRVTISKDGARVELKCSAGCLESLVLAALDLPPSALVLSGSDAGKKAPATKPSKKAAADAMRASQAAKKGGAAQSKPTAKPSNVVSIADKKAAIDFAAEREYVGGNFETEKAILGQCLLNPALLAKVRTAKVLKDLQLPASQVILKAMLELDAQGITPDPITIVAHLQETGEIGVLKAGGGSGADAIAYIGRLDDGVPFTDNIDSYCRMVKVLGEKHRAAEKIASANLAIDAGEDPRDVLKKLRTGKRPFASAPAPPSSGEGVGQMGALDWWIEQMPPTVFARGLFYRYDNGLWAPFEEPLIRQEITAVVRRLQSKYLKFQSSVISSLLYLAQAELAIASSRLDENPDFLVTGNGALEISTGVIHPHRLELYATTGVNYDYDPQAQAPTWYAYLDRLTETLGKDVIDFLQEFVGLCLTSDTSFEKAVWLHGPMGSGKGTFIDGIKAALSDRYCILNPSDVDKSRFMLSDIGGKTLAICQEMPGGYTRSWHVMDQIISGERIKVDVKNKAPILVDPICHLLCAMTSLPQTDAADGIFRRAIPIPFPALAFGQEDTTVKTRIKQEGAGILLWALAGLRRLRKRGRLVIPAIAERARKDFQATSDIEAAFVRESCYFTSVTATLIGLSPKEFETYDLIARYGKRGERKGERSSVLYQAYAAWCKRSNHWAKSSTQITAQWRRLGFNQYEAGGLPCWGGVRLRNEDLPNDEPSLLNRGPVIEKHRI